MTRVPFRSSTAAGRRLDRANTNTNDAKSEPVALPFRVVLADDHHLLRQGVRALLEANGLTVVGEAGDGREAIRIVQETQPDFAVLDALMPFLNGLDVVREIRRISPQTKSLLLTMHTDDSFVMESLRVG